MPLNVCKKLELLALLETEYKLFLKNSNFSKYSGYKTSDWAIFKKFWSVVKKKNKQINEHEK